MIRNPGIAVLTALLLAGCAAPADRLTFPQSAVEASSRGLSYDVHHRGRADFALITDEHGRLDVLAYDDNGDGKFDRFYRLSDYRDEDVPHLIVLLDSIPYEPVAWRYLHGEFRYFDPPRKVIPPFPSLTELCFTKLLGAPPLPGMVDTYFDADAGANARNLWKRALGGYRQPWERRLHYLANGFESGFTYLDPRPWFAAELARARQALDDSPDRVTLVYFISASAMLSKYGRMGLDEVLDGVQQLCMQVLYERRGAVKITLLADHGHNMMATTNVALEPWLKKAGFRVSDRLHDDRDAVLELLGLVTYAGVHTTRPAAAARAVCACPQVQQAAYLEGNRVIIRDARGAAAIEYRDHKLRYVSLDGDPLDYAPVVKSLQADAQGYADDETWFAATKDHEYPDAPRRLWDAFHGQVVHPPDVMVVMRDGYCCGDPYIENFIRMASTHGGLNQVNSATFVMSMTGRATKPMRTRDVLNAIEPGYEPSVRDR